MVSFCSLIGANCSHGRSSELAYAELVKLGHEKKCSYVRSICERPPLHTYTYLCSTTLLLLALLLVVCPSPASSQQNQNVTTYVYSQCNGVQFSSNDSFAHNFNAVMTTLMQKANQSLYASTKSESGLSNDSYVYAFYQCRGDVQKLSDCFTCVSNALVEDRQCGAGRGARVQYWGCYVRYEDFNFFNEPADDAIPLKVSGLGAQISDPLYRRNLGEALNKSASAAPMHALFGFNITSVGMVSNNPAYVLAQCVGVVSLARCTSCLSQVSNYSSVCNDSISGEVYYNGCFYIFGRSQNFLLSALTSASPAPTPSPQATSSGTPQETNKQQISAPTIVGVVVGVFLLLVAVAALAFCFIKRRKKMASSHGSLDSVLNERPSGFPQPGATRFSLEALREATDDFHPRNKLGEGGFGPVYQGKLITGKEVAIKMLSAESRQGKREFLNEVNLITIVQHRNLVQLIGCCIEESKRLLVYEYFQNRSLNLHLFEVSEDDVLDWNTRFDIILGIAQGLRYLHEDSHARIVHRDIKASNILLDEKLNPKIADFGLARFFADDVTHVTTRVAGTLGYLAPEYARNGRLTEKVDVYSFGVVALEIVSGRKMIDNREDMDKHNLLEWTWALYKRQEQVQIMDQRMQMKGAVNMEEVNQVVQVALLCTQSRPQARPSMSQVQTILQNRSDLQKLLTKPIIIGLSEEPLLASNEESITHVEAR